MINGNPNTMMLFMKSLDKYPTRYCPASQVIRMINGQGHALAADRWMRLDGFFVTGLLICVAAAPLIMPNNGGKTPPPARSSKMERSINTWPPYLFWMNNKDHRMMTNPRITVNKPATRRLGSTVNAGSQACQACAGTHGGPIEGKTKLGGGTLP